MPPLRIGVNALYLIPGGVGGTEIYLHALLAALAGIDSRNQYFVFTNRETGSGLVPVQPNFHACPQPCGPRFARAHRLGADRAAAGRRPPASGRAPQPRLHRSAVYCPCPAVTVFSRFAAQAPSRALPLVRSALLASAAAASAQISTLILADSEATRADLLRYYRLPPGKVRLAALGVDPLFFGLRRAPKGFLLAVSTLHPHKGLDTLLDAYAAFRSLRPGFRLVIAGLRGFHTAALERRRDRLGLRDSVEFTGWIPRWQLYDLYARAWAFLYPSTFEGFGMPILEALAAGIPPPARISSHSRASPEKRPCNSLRAIPARCVRPCSGWLRTTPCAPAWPPRAAPRRGVLLDRHRALYPGRH